MRIDTSDVLKDLDYKLKLLNLKKFSFASIDSESFFDEIDDR